MTVVNGRFLRATPVGLHRVAASMLDAAVGAGLDATVLAPPGVGDPRVDRHVWGPPGRFGDHAWEQVSLPAAARRRLVLSLANTAPLLARRSAVLVHDLAPVVGPQWFARSVRGYARLVLAGARRAERVLTVSEAVLRELVDAGVAADRIRVVRPALDPSFAPAPDDAVTAVRRRHGLDRPFALFVGWADPRKDVATAVAAHRAVRADVEHDLVVVGRPHVTFAQVQLPDDPSIRRLGYVSDDDLRALLTGAVALLYPSRYEGFGLPPLEAWACGTPAIVADIPVLRETTEGRGTLLPVGDVDAWARALRAALAGDLEVPSRPGWTWAEAGNALVRAV